MKKQLSNISMVAVAIILGAILVTAIYNGFNAKLSIRIKKHTDYQLNVTNDSIFILDGNRDVKHIPWDSSINNQLLKDNL